jgi:PTH1 family peptidyl-tRNA hydrolase
MALFQKKPQTTTDAPLYTLGMNKSVLIVGLGNPGKKYEGTRHNIGFTCLGAFAQAHEFDSWLHKKDLKSLVSTRSLGNVRVILCQPQTYMNKSGEAVQAVQHFYKINPQDVVVVHDELDIPFGQIRMRTGGSAAGHNGIKSLIEHIGESFNRVRIGIGANTAVPGPDFVLAKFSKDEQAHQKALTREVTSILTEFTYRGELQPETRSFLI